MNKLDCLKGILEKFSSADVQYDLSNVAYIGDDLLDLQCMNPIKEAGGVAGCPSNAVKEVGAACDFISQYNGGEGSVRDFAEYVIGCNQTENIPVDKVLKIRLNNAISYISKLCFPNLKVGKYNISPDFYYTVQEYTAFDENEVQYESHQKYIDIQWVYEGEEMLMITDNNRLVPSDRYNEEKDVVHYYNTCNMSAMIMRAGSCVVLFPKDAHKPSRFMGNACIVKKVVGKLKI